jgi:hypothetical protein
VKVIGVSRIIFWSKRDAEITAGFALHLAQKLGFGPCALPVMQDRYLPAIPQREA